MAEKLTLIFFTDTTCTSGVDPEIYEKFNELLVNRYGCDFTVEFRGYDPFDGAKYQNELRRQQIEGEQVDIIYTGLGTATFCDTYNVAIEDGLLEPLGAMLETEYGRMLWTSYSKNLWARVCRDGEYYGVYNLAVASVNSTIIVNAKYVTDESVVQNIKTLGDVYAFLDSFGEIEEGVIPLVADLDDLYEFEGGYIFSDWVIGKENNGKWEACFALEDEKYLSYLAALKKYGTAEGASRGTAGKLGRFVVMIDKKDMNDYNGSFLAVKENVKSSDYYEMEVYECAVADGWLDNITNGAIGIASWSQYKDEALQLLALIASEPELSNLLVLGLEDVHYTVKDGRLDFENKDYSNGRVPLWTCAMGNYMITHPYLLEPIDKTGTYDSYKVKQGIASLYGIDTSKYSTLKNAISLMKNSEKNIGWYCKDNNMELLEELRTRAKNIGIEKMIDDINEQLKEAQNNIK